MYSKKKEECLGSWQEPLNKSLMNHGISNTLKGKERQDKLRENAGVNGLDIPRRLKMFIVSWDERR